MVLTYTIKPSDEPGYSIFSIDRKVWYQPYEPKTTLAEIEELFFSKYQESTDPAERLKFLKYFNRIAELRNEIEYGIKE